MTKLSTCTMILLCGILAACSSSRADTPKEKEKEKVFKFEDGNYTMTSTAKVGEREDKKEREVRVTVKDGKVRISTEDLPEPMEGKLDGNDFSAEVEEAGKIKLKGKLTADNELSGTISGRVRDGEITGTFKLVKVKG